MLRQHQIDIQVRYYETDGQGFVHHANYFVYFELGRTELLRAAGRGYEQLEDSGFHLVVAKMSCQYHRPCRFGDTLVLKTTTVQAKGARAVHRYELFRDGQLLAEGESTVACIDHGGKVRRLPDWLLGENT